MLEQSSSLLRLLAIGSALIVLVWLLLQSKPAPIISNWNNQQSGPISGQAQPITGAAQPVGRGLGYVEKPQGSPLQGKVVLTQGYGVGSHAPAAVWGGVDLALDGNGDGGADPKITMGAPIYATHSGIASVRPDTWPAGNYLAITNDHYKTAFAHLSQYAVEDGQPVEVGQVVGYIGTTGQSSGPHLHYEVWQDGTNVNPLDYDALGGQ